MKRIEDVPLNPRLNAFKSAREKNASKLKRKIFDKRGTHGNSVWTFGSVTLVVSLVQQVGADSTKYCVFHTWVLSKSSTFQQGKEVHLGNFS